MGTEVSGQRKPPLYPTLVGYLPLLLSLAPDPAAPSWPRQTSCHRVVCGHLTGAVPQSPLPTSPARQPPVALGAAVCWEVASLGLTLWVLAAGLTQQVLSICPCLPLAGPPGPIQNAPCLATRGLRGVLA